MHVASFPGGLPPEICCGTDQGICVTIGNFDGVHLGHQALLAHARARANNARRHLVTVTFDPHPLEVLAPHLAPPRLTDTSTRLRLLQACSVDAVLLLPFTRELATLDPETFVRDILIEGVNARDMLIGYDFSLGKGRAGTGAVLAALGRKLHYTCERFGPHLVDGEPVSSTRIRQCIRTGDMPGAAALLGRPHCVHGTVISGFQRGHKLGFPTANFAPPTVQLPPPGAYATLAKLGIERFPAVTSVGTNPTFGGGALTIETHLLDFHRALYNQDLEIDFIHHLRGQIKFDGPQALRSQIEADIAQTRAILASTKY